MSVWTKVGNLWTERLSDLAAGVLGMCRTLRAHLRTRLEGEIPFHRLQGMGCECAVMMVFWMVTATFGPHFITFNRHSKCS